MCDSVAVALCRTCSSVKLEARAKSSGNDYVMEYIRLSIAPIFSHHRLTNTVPQCATNLNLSRNGQRQKPRRQLQDLTNQQCCLTGYVHIVGLDHIHQCLKEWKTKKKGGDGNVKRHGKQKSSSKSVGILQLPTLPSSFFFLPISFAFL